MMPKEMDRPLNLLLLKLHINVSPAKTKKTHENSDTATARYHNCCAGIKGVISFYGPTDMLWSYDHPTKPLIMNSKKVLRDFVGGSPDQVPDKYLASSPMHHVSTLTVPTLLVHGRNDAHVYQRQSYRLKEKLDSFGVKNFFLALPWATHGCEYKLSSPSGQLAIYCVERFLYAVTQVH